MKAALILLFSVSLFAADLEKQLIDAYQAAHHWGGEEPTDPERAKQIAEGSKKDCAKAIKIAEKGLKDKKKSPKSAAFMLQIASICLMKPAEQDRWKKEAPALCKTAEPYLKKVDPATDPDAQSAYLAMCPELAKQAWPK